MKKVLLPLILVMTFSLCAQAQFRADEPRPHDISGPFVNTQAASIESGLVSFFKNRVKMSQSYSMNFSSFGGSFQNINAYTNTLEFLFSEDLTGRVDVSFLHSPFGSSGLYGNQMQPQIQISNAELNYRIGENTRIQLQYRQLPRGMGGFGGFGNPYYGFNRFNPWY